MSIKRILNQVASNPFRFGRALGARGDQAVARIADVNTVIDAYNNLNVYRNVHFGLTSSNNGIVFESFVSGSDNPDCEACTCTGPGTCNAECQGVNGDCGNPKSGSLVITGVTQLALGVYELTLNPNMPFMANPRAYGMFVSQLENITHQVQISKIYNNNKIKIETFIAGVPSGLVLNKTPFIFNIYPDKRSDLYCGLC